MIYNRLDRLVTAIEDRFGKSLSPVLVSVFLLICAAIYVRPAVECVVLGCRYAAMSNHPFQVTENSYLAYRIFTPVVSYLLGLRGQLIIVTNLLFAAGLLVAVYWYMRSRAPRPADAFVASAALAFSLVTLTTIYYGGYCDSATYLVIFLMWWLRRSSSWFYLLFLAGLLNRESILFLVPWFLWEKWEVRRSMSSYVREVVLGFGASAAIYAAIRLWITSQVDSQYTLAYYLDPLLKNPFHWIAQSFPYQGLGWFTVFKALWVIPILAIIAMWRDGRRRDLIGIAILLAGTWAQMVVAFDSSRMLTLGFMVIVIALEYLFTTGAFGFRNFAFALLVLNLFVPQLYTAAHTIEMMHSTPTNLLQILLFDKAHW